jgi:hypothetical protein
MSSERGCHDKSTVNDRTPCYGAVQVDTIDRIVRVFNDSRQSQRFLLHRHIPPKNDEADAEPDATCEEDGDDVRLHKGHSREANQVCGVVNGRRGHLRDCDQQSPEHLRRYRQIPRHVSGIERIQGDALLSHDLKRKPVVMNREGYGYYSVRSRHQCDPDHTDCYQGVQVALNETCQPKAADL